MFLTAFAFSVGIITWGFLELGSDHYGEIIGFLSLSIEVSAF